MHRRYTLLAVCRSSFRQALVTAASETRSLGAMSNRSNSACAIRLSGSLRDGFTPFFFNNCQNWFNHQFLGQLLAIVAPELLNRNSMSISWSTSSCVNSEREIPFSVIAAERFAVTALVFSRMYDATMI